MRWPLRTLNGSKQHSDKVFSPWNDPIPIQRAWCLYEIITAFEDSKITLHIKLPSTQSNSLKSNRI